MGLPLHESFVPILGSPSAMSNLQKYLMWLDTDLILWNIAFVLSIKVMVWQKKIKSGYIFLFHKKLYVKATQIT